MSKTYNNVHGVLGSVNLVHVTQAIPSPRPISQCRINRIIVLVKNRFVDGAL